jgi:hypothetical protein
MSGEGVGLGAAEFREVDVTLKKMSSGGLLRSNDSAGGEERELGTVAERLLPMV